jgi:hypothetical protein
MLERSTFLLELRLADLPGWGLDVECRGVPGTIRDMVVGALKAKGVRFPDRRTMKTTRTKLRETFAKLQARGVARTVGSGKATRRTLV